jgi:colanic acid biosynthesis glycosyl transferase WcaI
MRILVVTQYFYPEHFKVNDLVEQWTRRGHEVTVLTGLPNYPEGKIYSGYSSWRSRVSSFCGAKVIRVPIVPRGKGRGLRLLVNYLSYAVSASLVSLKLREAIDLVFIYQLSPVTIAIPGLLLKKIRKRKAVMWVQDLWPDSVIDAGNIKSRLVKRILNVLVRNIYQRCDRLLLSSKGFQESISQYGIPSNIMSFLPNWAEDIYKPRSASSYFEHEESLPGGFMILFAGNMGEAQDFPSIIRAADKLRHYTEIKWVILGNGRCFDWTNKEVVRQGLSETVHCLGRFPAKTMPHFFARADAMLMTLKKSKIFSLTIPSKLQTYMACGRPILTMLDGEGSRIVEEAGAGLVSDSGDYEALAKNVLKASKLSKEDREALGENALKYYRDQFGRERLLAGLEKTLMEVVNESSP